jgi:hypothetical protein
MKILYKTREKAYKTNETSMNQDPTVYTKMNNKKRRRKAIRVQTKKEREREREREKRSYAS